MITIIMPVSRKDYLKAVFASLEMLECDAGNTNILTYVDGDYQLYEMARNFTQESKFNQRLCVHRKRGNPNVGSVVRRRQRIADIHNELKAELGKADFFFLIEDDTVVPPNAIQVLTGIAALNRNIGIVSGVELGRWGYTHVGAWRVNDVYVPTHFKSVPLEEGVKQVDATGLYCCVVRAEHYFNHQFAPMEAIGPDVNFGLWLRQEGYKNYVDFSVRCIHMTQKGPITIAGSKIDIVELIQHGSKWVQGVEQNEN